MGEHFSLMDADGFFLYDVQQTNTNIECIYYNRAPLSCLPAGKAQRNKAGRMAENVARGRLKKNTPGCPYWCFNQL